MEKDEPLIEEEEEEIFRAESFDDHRPVVVSSWKDRIGQKDKKELIVISVIIAILLVITCGVLAVSLWWLGTYDEGSVESYNKTANKIIEKARENTDKYFSILTRFTDLYPARICRLAYQKMKIQYKIDKLTNITLVQKIYKMEFSG